MKFKIERYGIKIIPESKLDEAYIEDTLGLRSNGDTILLKRVDVFNLSYLAFLQTEKFN